MKRIQLSLVMMLSLFVWSCNEAEKKENQKEEKLSKKTQKDSAKEEVTPTKILFVLTNHAQLGETGDSTGFFLSEAAHPWHVLKDEYQIDFVSPKGGKAPVDGFDLEDTINAAFWNNDKIQEQINNTKKPSEINPEEYLAIHYVGGHGTMWDFPENQELAKIASKIYENGGVVSAVCHGPAGLLNVRLSNTNYLLKDKKVTGFTNEEEAAVELTEVVPFLLENQMRSRKAQFVKSEKFTKNVVVDQRIITGQNPQSATGVGKAIQSELVTVARSK